MTGDLIQGGFILIARKLLKGGIMEKPPLYIKLWVWMVGEASFKDHGGLKRGQFFTNIDRMRKSMTYKVGARIERPTRKQIRLVYEYLAEIDAIKILKVSHGMIITIVNYDFYQNPLNYEGNILKSGHNPESPSKGTPKGTRKGTEKDDITNRDYSDIFEHESPEGHAEGKPESPSKGTLLRKKGIERKDISPDLFSLRKRYSDQNLLNQVFAAIASTRKAGKVSESVLTAQLQKWLRFPPEQVEAGIRTYLEKGYADQGRREEYLLGIIRNGNNGAKSTTPKQSTGSTLLDAYYERHGN